MARRAQLTRATPYAVTGCNEYEPPASTRRTCGDRAEKRGGGEVLRTASHHRGAARPGPPLTARRLLTAAGAALVVALLFLAYLRVSRTYPENSDESNDLLMAWDMLHGNVLLHGWYLSDVSFITTELPQYTLLVWLFGLHADTAHIAAAMTYTLVLILAVLLARGPGGRCPGRGPGADAADGRSGVRPPARRGRLRPAAVPRSHRHGRAAPADLAGPRPLPAALVHRGGRRAAADLGARRRSAGSPGRRGAAGGGVRAARRPRGPPPGRPPVRAILRANWYELSLAVAAIAAQGLASLAGLLQAYLHPVPYQLAPLRTWPKHAYVTGKGLLALFGAKPEGPPAALAFSLLHLAGVVLVAWAAWRVARHFLSWPDMISQILLVAMVLNVAAYVPSTLANATDLNAREFAIVLPYGAVLAGRTLAASLRAPGARPCWPAGRRPDRRRPARRLCGQPRLGRRPAAGPPDERAAGHLPRGSPPDQRDRRLLGIERGHGGQRRRRHDPGRAARHPAAGPVGGQGPPGTTPDPAGPTSW